MLVHGDTWVTQNITIRNPNPARRGCVSTLGMVVDVSANWVRPIGGWWMFLEVPASNGVLGPLTIEEPYKYSVETTGHITRLA